MLTQTLQARARALRLLAYRPVHDSKPCKGNRAMTRASLSDCAIMRRVLTPLATKPSMVLSMQSLTPSPLHLAALAGLSVYFGSTLGPCGLRLLPC